jgi:hypothetical protein
VTASRFRTLLRAWLALFVLRLLSGWAESASVLGSGGETTLVGARFAGALSVAAAWAILLLVGFIGMYRFWQPAPHLFLGAYLFAFVPWPYFPPDRLFPSGWEVLFDGLGTMMAGLIYGVAVLGSATPLFERRATG